MPEGEDGPVPGLMDFVEIVVTFGLPADRSANDGDGDITDPTNKPGLETHPFITGCALSRLHSQPLMKGNLHRFRGFDVRNSRHPRFALFEECRHFAPVFPLADTAVIHDPEA